MSPAVREIERRLPTDIDTIAQQEVDNYIEHIEKKTETQDAQSQSNQQQTVADDQQNQAPAVSVRPIEEKKNIVLPLQKEEISAGLHSNVASGLRWLAEWCLMMIRKYPGRVFYMHKQTQ